MAFKCTFGMHEWSGCKCSSCGKARDEDHDWAKDCEVCGRCRKTRIGAHRWDGCKCLTCRRTRDQGHDWRKNCEKCSNCGSPRPDGHAWSGCKCSVCSRTRDEQHAWEGCRCSTCGAKRDQEHEWSGCTCIRCEKAREASDDSAHDWSSNCSKCLKCGARRSEANHKWSGSTCMTCGKTAELDVKVSDLDSMMNLAMYIGKSPDRLAQAWPIAVPDELRDFIRNALWSRDTFGDVSCAHEGEGEGQRGYRISEFHRAVLTLADHLSHEKQLEPAAAFLRAVTQFWHDAGRGVTWANAECTIPVVSYFIGDREMDVSLLLRTLRLPWVLLGQPYFLKKCMTLPCACRPQHQLEHVVEAECVAAMANLDSVLQHNHILSNYTNLSAGGALTLYETVCQAPVCVDLKKRLVGEWVEFCFSRKLYAFQGLWSSSTELLDSLNQQPTGTTHKAFYERQKSA